MGEMLRNANLVITAWDGDLLVGISRSMSDFAYCTYLSDLAVRLSHQRRGIGKELVRLTKLESGPKTTVILLSAPRLWTTTRASASHNILRRGLCADAPRHFGEAHTDVAFRSSAGAMLDFSI